MEDNNINPKAPINIKRDGKILIGSPAFVLINSKYFPIYPNDAITEWVDTNVDLGICISNRGFIECKLQPAETITLVVKEGIVNKYFLLKYLFRTLILGLLFYSFLKQPNNSEISDYLNLGIFSLIYIYIAYGNIGKDYFQLCEE